MASFAAAAAVFAAPSFSSKVNVISLPIRPSDDSSAGDLTIHLKQVNSFSACASEPNATKSSRRASLSTLFKPLKGTLLLVHGSMACKEQYDDLMLSLEPWLVKNSYVCESFDAIGCGQSSKPAVYDAYGERALQSDLKTVFDKCKHPSNNYIVGHSYGTSQVVKLVNEMSDAERSSVSGIILLSGSMPGRDGGHPIMMLPCFLLNWLQPILSNAFREKAYAAGTDSAILDKSLERSSCNPMNVCKYFYVQSKWATMQECKGVTCKALVVHGSADQILPIEQGRTLAAALPSSEFVEVQGCSHQIMEERPMELADIMTRFMS